MTSDELLNVGQIAQRLGVSRWIVSAIKTAGTTIGDPCFTGRYSDVKRVRDWLIRHPEFVANHWHRHRGAIIRQLGIEPRQPA